MPTDSFSLDWGTAQETASFSIDSGTYPATAHEVNTDRETSENSANPGQPMVLVNFKFPEVRTTKPKRGRGKDSTETEVVVEHDRTLPKYFTFSHPVSLGMAKEYLVACGVATEDELEEQMDWLQVKELFERTQGADIAVRVTKRPPKAKEQDRSQPDKFGNINQVGQIFSKDSRQYEIAANAVGDTISSEEITYASKRSSKK